jgi:hypothetical protein
MGRGLYVKNERCIHPQAKPSHGFFWATTYCYSHTHTTASTSRVGSVCNVSRFLSRTIYYPMLGEAASPPEAGEEVEVGAEADAFNSVIEAAVAMVAVDGAMVFGAS